MDKCIQDMYAESVHVYELPRQWDGKNPNTPKECGTHHHNWHIIITCWFSLLGWIKCENTQILRIGRSLEEHATRQPTSAHTGCFLTIDSLWPGPLALYLHICTTTIAQLLPVPNMLLLQSYYSFLSSKNPNNNNQETIFGNMQWLEQKGESKPGKPPLAVEVLVSTDSIVYRSHRPNIFLLFWLRWFYNLISHYVLWNSMKAIRKKRNYKKW